MSDKSVEVLINKFKRTTLKESIKNNVDKVKETELAPLKDKSLIPDRHADDKEDKNIIKAQVKTKIEEYGLKYLFRLMSQDELTKLYAPFEEKGDDVKKRTKIFLIRRLTKKVLTLTLAGYVKKYAAKKPFIDIIKPYVVTDPATFEADLPKDIRNTGFEMFLWDTPVVTLKKMVADLGIDTDSSNPEYLIKTIINGKVPKSKKAKPVVVEFVETKQKLSKKLSYQDIFQHYYLEELQDYCRENEITVSGTKSEVIKRIMLHLAGEWEQKVKPEPLTDAEKQEKYKIKLAEQKAKRAEIRAKKEKIASERKAAAAAKKAAKATAASKEEEEEEDDVEEDVDSSDEEEEVEDAEEEEETSGSKVGSSQVDDEDDETEVPETHLKPVPVESKPKTKTNTVAEKPVVTSEQKKTKLKDEIRTSSGPTTPNKKKPANK